MIGKTSQEVFIGVECILDRFMRNLFQGESCHDHSGSLCPYRRSRGSGRGRLLWAATLGSYEDVPAHDFLVILTDANGRFGRDDVQFAYNPSTSDNGRRHLEIMGEYHLVAANTLFDECPLSVGLHHYMIQMKEQCYQL